MTDDQVIFHEMGDSALRAEIELESTPERVYAAWTDPAEFVKWFGPRSGGELVIDSLDCTIGGDFDVTMIFSDGDRVRLSGTYEELNPFNRISFTWQWDGPTAPPSQTLITVDLSPSHIGTRLILTHERFATIEARDQHQQGWAPILVKLATVLSKNA